MMLPEQQKQAVLLRARQVPILETLEMEISELDTGYCVSIVPHKTIYDGIFNSFHGGMLQTVADTTACLAVLTVAGSEANITTTDMNIRFLSPCIGPVTAKATVIKAGRTMCPVSVELLDNTNKLVAIAQVNYIILRVE